LSYSFSYFSSSSPHSISSKPKPLRFQKGRIEAGTAGMVNGGDQLRQARPSGGIEMEEEDEKSSNL
jgi:hypothetical protein